MRRMHIRTKEYNNRIIHPLMKDYDGRTMRVRMNSLEIKMEMRKDHARIIVLIIP
jgi:hypothetical protein